MAMAGLILHVSCPTHGECPGIDPCRDFHSQNGLSPQSSPCSTFNHPVCDLGILINNLVLMGIIALELNMNVGAFGYICCFVQILEESMIKFKGLAGAVIALLSFLSAAGPASAQQVNGTWGWPSATTTVSNKQLPAPDPKFGGVIKQRCAAVQARRAPRVVPPKGAPNVLLLSSPTTPVSACRSTFGGVIPTPAMDRIANEGLRYNRARRPRWCSPTRAALITDATTIRPASASFPSSPRVSRATTASSARTRRRSAACWWTTATPPRGSARTTTCRPSRPARPGPSTSGRAAWASSISIGFIGGDANQWQPNLFRNTTPIFPFQGKPEGSWNLVTAMADDAID